MSHYADILVETWLSDKILDAEVNIPGYNIYRSDKCGRKRGGTCIYTRSDLPVSRLLCYSNGVVDTITIKIPSLDLVVNGMYRPPDTTYEEFKDAIDKIEKSINDDNNDNTTSNIVMTSTRVSAMIAYI